MPKTAAQIMFDVEIGAATAKLSKLSRKLDSVTDGMKKAGKSSADAKDATKDWGKGVGTAVASLLKYRAAMLGIETITTSVKNAWDSIRESQRQAASLQVSSGVKLSEMASFIGPHSDITGAEVADLIRSRKMGDYGLAAQAVQQAVSSKSATSKVSDIVAGSVPLFEELWGLKEDENLVGIPAAAGRLIGAAGGMDYKGITPEQNFRAQAEFLFALNNEALATTQADVVNNILPGVVTSMAMGIDQAVAGASIAVAGTAAGDTHGKETSSTFAKAVDAVMIHAAKETGLLDKMNKIGSQGMLDLLYDRGTAENLKAIGGTDNLERIRDSALGLVSRGDDELGKVLERYGLSKDTPWNKETLDELEKRGVDVKSALPGRALPKVQIGRLLMGRNDPEMFNIYGEALKNLGGGLKSADDVIRANLRMDKRIEQMKLAGGEALANEIEQKKNEEFRKMNNPAGAAEAQSVAMLEALDAQSAEDHGVSGLPGTQKMMRRWIQRRFDIAAADAIATGSPGLKKDFNEAIIKRHTHDGQSMGTGNNWTQSAFLAATGYVAGQPGRAMKQVNPAHGIGGLFPTYKNADEMPTDGVYGWLYKTMVNTVGSAEAQRKLNEKLENGVINVNVVNPDTRPPAGVDSNRLNQGS